MLASCSSRARASAGLAGQAFDHIKDLWRQVDPRCKGSIRPRAFLKLIQKARLPFGCGGNLSSWRLLLYLNRLHLPLTKQYNTHVKRHTGSRMRGLSGSFGAAMQPDADVEARRGGGRRNERGFGRGGTRGSPHGAC